MEKMSVARALIELKTLDKRIQKRVGSFQPNVPVVGGQMPTSYPNTQAEFEKDAKAAKQSIADLIAQRRKIKTGIVQSNAVTRVEVAGEKMTVAEAIERKASIAYEKLLRDRAGTVYGSVVEFIESHNKGVNDQLQQLLEVMVGKDGDVDAKDHAAVSEPFLAARKAELVDPLGIKAFIEEVEQRIEDFESGVDIALTESNARTEIEV